MNQITARSRRFAMALACAALGVRGQTMQAPDITQDSRRCTWSRMRISTRNGAGSFRRSISEYLLKTMRVNFDYIEKYPHYVFNWTGANRYRLMKEYFPDDYARMKQYVAAGRWFPGGIFHGRRRREPAQRGSASSARCSTAIRTSARNSARPARSTCCRTASDFRRRCRAFWPTRGVKGFSTQKL